jgi:hypothetical protein
MRGGSRTGGAAVRVACWLSLCVAFLPAPPLHAGPPPKADIADARLTFHGWSPDSRWIAYTRHFRARRLPDGSLEPPRDQRLHRRVRDGRLTGFGSQVGRDVAAHAEAHGYIAAALPRVSEGPHRFVFGDGLFSLEIDIGRTLGFTLNHRGTRLFRHTFDRLYVGFEPELYPSPDGRQAILVFHLDSGWETDAAIFPLRLSAARRPADAPPPRNPVR